MRRVYAESRRAGRDLFVFTWAAELSARYNAIATSAG